MPLRSPYFPLFLGDFAFANVHLYQAQDSLEVSGVLTVMTLGMLVNLCRQIVFVCFFNIISLVLTMLPGRFYAAFAKTAFKGESQQSLHHFWYVSYRNKSTSHLEVLLPFYSAITVFA